MNRTFTCVAIAALSLFIGQPAAGASAEGALGLPPLEDGAYQTLVDRVNAGQVSEYDQVLASLDKYVAAHADDIVAAVERCRFIDYFANSDDAVVESAPDQAKACREALNDHALVDSAPVQLYLLDRAWGDEVIRKGEQLLPASKRWTPSQQARLHEVLADNYANTNLLKAGPYAMSATRLDPRSTVRLIAAEYLIRIGAKARAARMIREMPADLWRPDLLDSAVKLLLSMDASRAAEDLVQAHGDVALDAGTRVLLARSLFASGRQDAARRLVRAASEVTKGRYISSATLREVFDLERQYGSMESATAAYRRLRSEGYKADPFAHHRLALSLRFPLAPWQAQDALGVGALVLMLLACVLSPLVVVAPLHYRSVVKQLRGQAVAPATPGAPWSLRQVWYVLAVFQLTGIGAMYVLDYPDFHAAFLESHGFPAQYETLSTDRQLGNSMLLSSALAALALLPLLRRESWRSLLLGEWSIKRSVFTGIGVALLLVIVNAIVTSAIRYASRGALLGTDTTRAIQGIHSAYGAFAAFGYAAVLVPITEELVFRGVLLRAISRYYAFWIALLLQAGIFTIWHEDTSSYPYIFTLALLTAWLARRSGGLLAPIVLHATNNALVVLQLIAVSHAFERWM